MTALPSAENSNTEDNKNNSLSENKEEENTDKEENIVEEDESLFILLENSFENLEKIHKMKSKYNIITYKDWAALTYEDAFYFDNKRSFWVYFKTLLITKHPILKFIFVKTLRIPAAIFYAQLFFSISLNSSINAMFYSDDFIDNMALDYLNGKVKIN